MIILIILIIVLLLSFLIIKNLFKNKETILEDVSLKEEIASSNNGFALMLEQSDGTYQESTSNSWPTDMVFNSELSGCINTDGKKIENSLTYDKTNNVVNVSVGETSYCYVYFDIKPSVEKFCNIGDNLGACLKNNRTSLANLSDNIEAGLYRYQGSNSEVDDNYVCIGTTNKTTCISNPDDYLFRIIGVNDNNQLKLITDIPFNIGIPVKWYSDDSSNITWPNSIAYSAANSLSYYIKNGWESKIANTQWKYGSVDGMNKSASDMYAAENALTNTVTAKGALMYAHDYYYSYQSGGLNCSAAGAYEQCKNSWMHLSHNPNVGSVFTLNNERIITTSPYLSSGWGQWAIYTDGFVFGVSSTQGALIRPVFYLNSDELYNGGKGTLDDPIMLTEPIAAAIINNASSTELWNSTLEDDGYRYVGTNPNNYICFGTTNKNTCLSDTDKYMYRIIGIFEDNSGNKHLKLIKKEALNTAYAWHSDTYADVDWSDSDLYNGLNGSYFLTNTSYPYMQQASWTNKIATWNYTMTNTMTDETSNNTSSEGIEYGFSSPKSVYLHELNRSSKSSQTCYRYENTTANCSAGEWKTLNTKISLMYVSDYLLSLGSSALNYTSYSNSSTMKTGWIHLSHNDAGNVSSNEWTMTRYGDDTIYYNSRDIRATGDTSFNSLDSSLYVRPVFYLESDVELNGGTGVSINPYLIKE